MSRDNRHITVADIRARKGAAEPLACLTAYTAPMAQLLDAHVDLLLVGDSVGMALYGMDNTLQVTLEIMIAHGKAVVRASKRACVVVDMPFGTYEENPEQAFRNATLIMRETNCDAVKLEGGAAMAPTIEYLTRRNIPVMAHIGLQPQSVLKEGGYRVKGKTPESEATIMADAKAVEAAGAFAVVIEGTVGDVADSITKAIRIPTIGIGASAGCDGQILVTEDMLGLLSGHTPKFVKKYADLGAVIDKAVSTYAAEVRARQFPSSEYLYSRPKLVETDKKAS